MKYLINFYQIISQYPLIQLLLLFFFTICCITILVVGFIILLDGFNRPNVPQYSFSIILDRIIPIVILLTPIILPFTFFDYISYFSRFSLCIILHCVITVPIIHYWSYIRRWDDLKDNFRLYLSWNHPRLYKDISIALLYLFIFGLYFSLNRYLRLGTVIDCNVVIAFLLNESFILAFLISLVFIFYIVYFLSSFLFFVIYVKTYIWKTLSILLYSIHIHCLKYHYYFKCLGFIYKVHFIFHDIVSGSVGGTTFDKKSCNIFRRFLSKIYYRPQPILLLIPIFILVEALFNSGIIFYSIYFSFYLLIIYNFLHLFNAFGTMLFVKDVCLSDYLSLNFKNPHFPLYFWAYVRNPLLHFGFIIPFDDRITQLIQMNSLVNDQRFSRLKDRRHWYLIGRVWGHPRYNGITYFNRNKPLKWRIRLSASLLSKTHLRFFHSSRVLLSPLQQKIHPLTPLFVRKNPLALLALLNSPQQDYAILQKASKGILFPSPSTLYTSIDVMLQDKPKGLTETLEDNLAKTMSILVSRGVIVGTYASMKTRFGHPINSMQARPDLVLQWNNSSYYFKGYIGLDQKHHYPTNSGRNQILTRVDDYKQILTEFRVSLELKFDVTFEMEQALNELLESSTNFENHLDIWAKNINLFPNTWKPPLLLNKTFDESYLRPEIVEMLRKGELEIIRVSDYLYTAQVSENLSDLSDEALSNLEGSFIQEMLGSSPY